MTRVILIGLAMLLAGCVPPERYFWGGYEDTLYRSYREPAAQATYTESLAKATVRGAETGKIAPGLYAEYGYMLMQAGRGTEAVAAFQAEKRRWPESTVLMDRMIGLTNGKSIGSVPIAAPKVGS